MAEAQQHKAPKKVADQNVDVMELEPVKQIEIETKNGCQLLHLEYPKDNDPREALFQYAVDSNWVVTEMTSHGANLESIFRTLTMEEGTNA